MERPEPSSRSGVEVEALRVSAYEIPTDGPEGRESDGTQIWSSTTLVLVEAEAGGITGLGYTYGDRAVGTLIDSKLRQAVEGGNPMTVGHLWQKQREALRNVGRPGVGSMAIAAVDIALWDLRAKLLAVPLFRLVGGFHDHTPIYASGGFCNYPVARLESQVRGWIEQGIGRVKVKTSRDPAADPERLDVVSRAIGDDATLMVDANGALSRKAALAWAHRFRQDWGASWFEEPVSSDDPAGLRLLRDQGPPGLDIAAGEYAFIQRDFLDLIDVVDCLQADVTRCGGITGLLQIGGLASARGIDLSAHCAPAVSAHAFCGVEKLRHLEYFHDHVRVESILFDGVLEPDRAARGSLRPDPARPGLGLVLKQADAERYRI